MEEKKKPIPIASDNPSIVRIKEKCIQCGRCATVCEENMGFSYDIEKVKEPICVHCGQCILNCPVGALVPRYDYLKVKNYLHDTNKVMIVQTAPAIRVSMGDLFGAESGQNVEKKVVTALKKIGFHYVFDTTFGADLTIVEEASEFVERLKNQENLPQFTSCCPAWVKYIEMFHPKLISHLSTCKSPIAMQNSTIKTYFASMMEIDPEDIVTVAVTPCTAKKYEIKREEITDSDIVITASELSMLLKEENIDLLSLEESEYDSLLGRGSGGGVLFGTSGGVLESALRTAYYLITGKAPSKKLLQFTEIRGEKHVKEASVDLGPYSIKVLAVHGLSHVKEVLERLEKDGKSPYTFIEVMNCPSGCVGGGGQPLGVVSQQDEVNAKRREGLYQEDAEITFSSSYQNPDIISLYESYFGSFLSEKAKKVLHTSFQNRSDVFHKEESLI